MSRSEPHIPYDFVIWWVIHTICGCAIGMFVILLPILAIVGIGSGLRFRDNIILSTWQLWIIIGVPIYGAFVGNLQWDKLLIGLVTRKQWMLASAVTTAMGVASFFLVLDIFPPFLLLLANGDRTVSDTWFATIIGLSLVTGIGIGIPYWYILRKTAYAHRLFIAILGSVFAAFMCAIVFDGLVEFYYFAPFEFFCVGLFLFHYQWGLCYGECWSRGGAYKLLGKSHFDIGIYRDWQICSTVV